MPSLTALEAIAERMHFLDDLSDLAADLGDARDAGAHFLAELVHLHHAGRDGLLHVADHVLDVQRGHRGLIGEPADLARHDQEAAAVFARLLGLDGGVDRQQVGLVGDLGDGGDDQVDVVGLLADDAKLGGDRGGRRRPVAAWSLSMSSRRVCPASASAAARSARSLTSFIVVDSSLLVAEISRTEAAISVVELPSVLHGRLLLPRRRARSRRPWTATARSPRVCDAR